MLASHARALQTVMGSGFAGYMPILASYHRLHFLKILLVLAVICIANHTAGGSRWVSSLELMVSDDGPYGTKTTYTQRKMHPDVILAPLLAFDGTVGGLDMVGVL